MPQFPDTSSDQRTASALHAHGKELIWGIVIVLCVAMIFFFNGTMQILDWRHQEQVKNSPEQIAPIVSTK